MKDQVIALRGAAPYIRLYRDKIFVVKLGGAVLADAEAADRLAQQCALLADLGIRLILVHGGGPQTTALSRRLGIEPQVVAGRRITDDQTLEVVKMTIAGQLNTDLVAALRRHDARAVGLTGVDAGLVVAGRRPPVHVTDDEGVTREVDFGNVGDIRAVDTKLLHDLLAAGYLPVVACLASGEDAAPLNVNADTFAESLAVALHAEKLILLTDRPGILRDAADPSTLVPFADADDLAGLIEAGVVRGGMRPKVEACIRAATSGVRRTHIIDGAAPQSLLVELFTGEGCGTMIVGEREKQFYQEHELA